MADIPHQPILGRVVQVMKRHGEFQGAQAGGKMPGRLGDTLNQILPQFAGQGCELRLRQLAEIRR